MDSHGKIWSYEFEKDKEISSGKLLLSEPFMFDENFRRTVVLLCSHDEENGTVGLVLNRPVNLPLQEVIEDFPALNARLFVGGPVGTDTIQFIHTLGDALEGSVQIAEQLYWGGNFEQLRERVAVGGVDGEAIHFFLGYSGWSPGQLKQELQDNAWIVAQATAPLLFRTDVSTLWKEIMMSMGGVYATMAGYPENPILN